MLKKPTKIIIYTDGGSRGNPGPAGIGVVILNEKNQVIKKYSEYLGKATNNEAEYQAVVFALKKVKALFGKKKIRTFNIEVKSDSELLINQLNGKYKVLGLKIQPLFLKIWNLKIDIQTGHFAPCNCCGAIKAKVKFILIPREKNKQADELVNEVLDQGLTAPLTLL